MIYPKTLEEFIDALTIDNRPNSASRNVAQYYIGEGKDREWIMNAYESFGGILSGLKVWYLIDFVVKSGRYIIPEKTEGVEYDENCVFGEIPPEDIPEGCYPYDCGYGGAWALSTKDDGAADRAAFEMFRRRHKEAYK